MACVLGCGVRQGAPPKPTPATTLEAAGERLAKVTGATLRGYSTCEFGRKRNPDARSVVVPKVKSRELLERIRGELGPGIVAFIGTTRWLGDEKHKGRVEIAMANATSQLDILRIARSNAHNYDMVTEDLVKKLAEYDRAHGIDIFHAETDTIELRLTKLPGDMAAFCRDLYGFCPDIVDQGVGSLAALEREIRKTREVFLWWD